MGDVANLEIVTRYLAAGPVRDWETLALLRTADWTEDWPQSGERIRGSDNWRTIHDQLPGGMPRSDVERIVGAEERWALMRDGRVAHETTYWASPFPAPEWRRQWVELDPVL